MGDLHQKYNLKSPAVKRLMREAAELSEPTEQYFAQPLEDNIFEWHFTIRGSPDTEFAGGHYHGKITLPPEYPMKPPSIILLTPNGRFELGKKICLSMSAHHPETWQPSWSIRTVLLALIGFMPTKGEGALGALDYTIEERKVMAARSLDWSCDTCQINNKTCLLQSKPGFESNMDEAKELATQISFKGEAEKLSESKSSELNEASPSNKPSTNIPASTPELRQRKPIFTTNQPHVEVVHRRSLFYVSVDYFTLGMMWIIAAVLVVLVVRRLAMEKENVTGGV
ncbi:ubiquitin-conjugating enzyme E2 J1 isoform X3 [Hydra vulgaris]|uniref:Ubiquitin-conjugating enzyme E2 J1 isoform X3 n=2 Tax=Hydra vulgaris TaxID=6087 RepID=A0ABM4BSS3_HYDVU